MFSLSQGSRVLSSSNIFVLCLALLPTGELVTGSGTRRDYTISTFNLTADAKIRTLTDFTNSTSSLIVLPTGELVSGSFDRTIKICQAQSGQLVRTL